MRRWSRRCRLRAATSVRTLKQRWSKRPCGMKTGNRTLATVACPPQKIAAEAGFTIPDDARFMMVPNHGKIGKEHRFSGEKLTT